MSGSHDRSGEQRYKSEVDRLAGGAVISSAGQAVGRTAGYASQVALARMFGPTAFGLYVLGATMVAFASILAQLGMDSGVVRYVSGYRADGDEPRVRGVVLLSLGATFAASIVLAGCMFFGAEFLAGGLFGKPELAALLRVFSVSVPFLTVMSMSLWATQGFQTVKYATYAQQVIQPLLNLALIVVFYLLSSQVVGAVVAYTLSMAFGCFLSIYYLARVFPGVMDRRVRARFEPRALVGASGPMLVANIVDNLNVWAAVAVLGVFASAGEVGVYNAAARTAALSTLVLLAFRGMFAPMVSELHGQGRHGDLDRIYKDVSAWIFTGSLAVFLLTTIFCREIMSVFGEEFISGWPALVVISVAQLFNASVGLTHSALAMTGHQRMVMTATLTSAAALISGSFLLVPAYGLMGAAAATTASILVANVVTLLALRGRLALWPYSRRYSKPLLAGLVAAAVTLAAKLALSAPVSAATAMALSPVFVFVFVTLLFAFGLSFSDRRLLDSLVSAARAIVRRP